MANVPNIPSVVVSINDQSFIQPILASGRTLLFPHFSKYGSEDIQIWATWSEYQEKFGNADPKKYGMAQLYIKGASIFTQSFVGKRLLPDDATFANIEVMFGADGTEEDSIVNQSDISGIRYNAVDRTLCTYAKGRGAGYNDIIVTFDSLPEYEKFYADEDGISKYKFNFLAANIFEKLDDGSTKQLNSNVIPFALVSVDPKNGATIKDIYDGKSLFIEDRFDLMTTYLGAFIKDDDATLERTMSIYDAGTPVFWDAEAGKAAIIIFEDNDLTVEYVSKSKDETVESVRVHWADSNGNDKYTIVTISDHQIVLTDDTDNGEQDSDVESFVIGNDYMFINFEVTNKGNFLANDVSIFTTTSAQGQSVFDAGFDVTGAAVTVNGRLQIEGKQYTVNGTKVTFESPLNFGDYVKIISQSEDSDANVKLDVYEFERYALYNALITQEFKLSAGSDGENLYINGQLNMNGPGEAGKQNAKMLLLDFYNNNAEIKEVLYPKWDFDYVVDFSMDSTIQAAITNLNDYLETSFGIHAPGITYNYTQDIDYRKYSLGISSYCNAIYSGEGNLKHYDDDLGRTIYMPSNYYAMLSHLYIDGTLGLAEPVANMNKGALKDAPIKLSYEPTSSEIEMLRSKQINAIISEPDGIYFIDQLTMYKKSSILSRIHAIKPILKVKKDLRKILKDALQSKDGNTAKNRVSMMVNDYMKDWVYDARKNPRGAFEYFKVSSDFDENKLTIKVFLTVKPLRSVEKINVTINVV